MRKLIFFLLALLVFVGCTDDEPAAAPQDVECCVNWAWSNGRGGDTRVLSSLLEAGSNDAPIDLLPTEYPEEIQLKCKGKDYLLSRGGTLNGCSEHAGFYHGYTCEPALKDIDAKKGVTATASIDDDEDVLYSETQDVEVDQLHLKITLHHRMALLRFVFRLDPRYAKIRYIHVKEIVFKEEGSTDPGFPVRLRDGGLVLGSDNTTSYRCAGYCYVDPEEVPTSTNLQIVCTYDIYDKDARLDGSMTADELAVHRTREDIEARNQLQLSNLLYDRTPVDQFQPGYYYDLRITLNPDYLYVLSDHDNSHLTIQ